MTPGPVLRLLLGEIGTSNMMMMMMIDDNDYDDDDDDDNDDWHGEFYWSWMSIIITI